MLRLNLKFRHNKSILIKHLLMRYIRNPPRLFKLPGCTVLSSTDINKTEQPSIIGIAIGAIALVGLIAGYFIWYVPYAKDRDALRTYVVANNVFFAFIKSSRGRGYNILSKVPLWFELITYSKDTEWAEIKVNGVGVCCLSIFA